MKPTRRLNLTPLEDRRVPANLFVNSLADDTAADNSLTLREAMLLVNNVGNAGAALGRALTTQEAAQVQTIAPFGSNDAIGFEPALTGGAGQQVISLGGTQLPPVMRDVRVEGPGANRLAIDAGGTSRVFDVFPATVTISGLTLRNGNEVYGGAIFNRAVLTVAECAITGNTAAAGGGIGNNGILTVVRSTISGNTATTYGGGVYNSVARASLSDTTISGNQAPGGAGVVNTFGAVLDLTNVTVSANSAGGGSGILSFNGARETLWNTVVSGNGPGADYLPSTDGGGGGAYNLLGNAPAGFDPARNLLDVVVPGLGPLADNGGPTRTMAPLPGSPLLDAGDPAAIVLDQRGRPIANGVRDIGAVESQGFPNTAPVLANVPPFLTVVPGAPVTFRATATDPDVVNGQPNKLTFSLIGAPPGASIDPDTGAFSWTPPDAAPLTSYQFRVRVTDDGSPAQSDTAVVGCTLMSAALVNGNLLVGGTAGNDTIAVNPSKDETTLRVTLNRQLVGTFPTAGLLGRVVVYGLDGNDRVTVNPRTALPADLYGGRGNDSLTGGAGGDRLFGESGNDKLVGGKGNDLLVGGDGDDTLSDVSGTNVLMGNYGADKLIGGSGDDLLIAGPTSFGRDPERATAVWNEWTSGASYADRVAHLTGTAGGLNNGNNVVAGQTAIDDQARDVLTGGKGMDWFVSSVGDTTDRKDPEQGLTV